ncbi:MAG: hypothetical protein U9Q99_00010 [Nanoarchaeota archaeon]|nr:hypothetical protein [Nanoarchaeota archaeon]
MKQKKFKNKKGQGDIIYFVVAVIALLMLAPIMLRIVNTSLDSFSESINNTSEVASDNVDYIHTTFVNFWDVLIALAFLINIILLFVFSFMVDSHPIFSLFYFISVIITLMFSHTVTAPISIIFGLNSFSTEVLQLPITDFIITNFDLLLLGIIIITGIIMYGKFKSGGSYQR